MPHRRRKRAVKQSSAFTPGPVNPLVALFSNAELEQRLDHSCDLRQALVVFEKLFPAHYLRAAVGEGLIQSIEHEGISQSARRKAAYFLAPKLAAAGDYAVIYLLASLLEDDSDHNSASALYLLALCGDSWIPDEPHFECWELICELLRRLQAKHGKEFDAVEFRSTLRSISYRFDGADAVSFMGDHAIRVQTLIKESFEEAERSDIAKQEESRSRAIETDRREHEMYYDPGQVFRHALDCISIHCSDPKLQRQYMNEAVYFADAGYIRRHAEPMLPPGIVPSKLEDGRIEYVRLKDIQEALLNSQGTGSRLLKQF
jgi:hypothetical protein